MYVTYFGSRKYPSYYRTFNHKVSVSVKRQGYVLDGGCGSETILEKLEHFGLGVALDVNRASLKLLMEKLNSLGLRSVSLVVASVEFLPFRKEVFDIVVLRDILEHVKNIDRTLHETASCLRNHGKTFITTSNLLNPVLFLDTVLPREVAQKIVEKFGASYHERNRRITPFSILKMRDRFLVREISMFSLPPFIRGKVYKDACSRHTFPKSYYLWLAFERITNIAGMKIFKEIMLIVAEKMFDMH